MTRREDGSALVQAILDTPHDFLSLLAYADWLAENGEEESSEAWRWMGTKQVTPEKSVNSWWYYHGRRSLNGDSAKFHILPDVLFNRVVDDDGDLGSAGWCLRFDNAWKAQMAAVHTWKKLSQKERKECWEWQP